jgi:hypothetical protein
MEKDLKELLLKDLCARLPYRVKFPMMCWDEETGETVRPVTLYSINKDGYCHVSEDDYSPYIDEIKPYLFPLSSMTEEQRQELESLMEITTIPVWGEILSPTPEYYDWLNKNHFDYRGLIEKSLALDATGLNIY